ARRPPGPPDRRLSQSGAVSRILTGFTGSVEECALDADVAAVERESVREVVVVGLGDQRRRENKRERGKTADARTRGMRVQKMTPGPSPLHRFTAYCIFCGATQLISGAGSGRNALTTEVAADSVAEGLPNGVLVAKDSVETTSFRRLNQWHLDIFREPNGQ